MSTTSRYMTEIVIPGPQVERLQAGVKGVPCMQVMRWALATIARKRQGAVTDVHRDCAGEDGLCVMRLRTPELPHGLGVIVAANGQVWFEYDRQGADASEAEAICRNITHAYAVIAIKRAMNKCGHQAGESRCQ